MAMNMDKKTIIVLAVVGSLGLLSAILGFSGEGTKPTYAYHYGGACYYPPNPAVGLGVCAVIFLIIAQVTIAVVGGCCGCCKSRAIPSGTNRIIGIVCAVFSWITALIAFGLLVTGISASQPGTRDRIYGLCWVPMDGLFAGAGVLTLTATALGLSSHVLLRRLPDGAAAAGPAATPVAGDVVIAMGQAQFPQQTPPKGNGQTPPPNNGQFPPPPPQGSVAPEPNQHFSPLAQRYEAHGPNHNQQVPSPVQGYGAHPRKQQFPLPDPGHGAHAPNQHPPPHAQAYAVQAPKVNVQFEPSNLLNVGERIHQVASFISDDGTVDESTSHDKALYQATEPTDGTTDKSTSHDKALY